MCEKPGDTRRRRRAFVTTGLERKRSAAAATDVNREAGYHHGMAVMMVAMAADRNHAGAPDRMTARIVVGHIALHPCRTMA